MLFNQLLAMRENMLADLLSSKNIAWGLINWLMKSKPTPVRLREDHELGLMLKGSYLKACILEGMHVIYLQRIGVNL